MRRNLDSGRSIPKQDDWLIDQVPAAAIKGLLNEYRNLDAEALQAKLTSLKADLPSAQAKEKLSRLTKDQKENLTQKRRLEMLQNEIEVVSYLLRKEDLHDGVLVDVHPAYENNVEHTVRAEQQKEAQETENDEMDALIAETEDEIDQSMTDVMMRDASKERTAREVEQNLDRQLQKETERQDRIESAERRAEWYAEQSAAQHKEAMRHVKEFQARRNDTNQSKNEAHQPVDAYRVQSARIKPESFWSRVKRSWFGGGDTQMTQQARAKEQALNTQILHERAVVAKELQAQQEKQPGFLSRWFNRKEEQGMKRSKAYGSNIEKVGGPKVTYGRNGEETVQPKTDREDRVA